MADTFNCPACGGPVEISGEAGKTVRCRYCHNTVIVPAELQGSIPSGGAAAAGGLPGTNRPALPRKDPQQIEAEIRLLLAARQKITAIKIFRQETGAGLKQAKEAVEAIDAGGSLDANLILPPENQASSFLEDASPLSKAAQLIQRGNKVDAVRLLRTQFDLSLKVAKDAADLLEKGQAVDIEWLRMKASQAASREANLPAQSASKRSSTYSFWVTLLGIILFIIIVLLFANVRF